MDDITHYFKDLTPKQQLQFDALLELYPAWNEKVNLISRKDIDSLFEKHILHSLAIAKFLPFKPGTKVLDIGTGGGFPGIPLAIFFPETEFVLCDSIAKKIAVAENIAESIGLLNTDFAIGRVEQLREQFDFIVSRAVAPMEQLFRWTHKLLSEKQRNPIPNGFLLLKGGDLEEEKKELLQLNRKLHIEEIPLSVYFSAPFFETKKLIYISR
ncbi:MAG: 16S rRNA (guanine(527)-N(7))-methyltransferase RsmG [Bacteroidia bacterium]|jgi:16S rRNA (guanine527-N7)-methyltransferase